MSASTTAGDATPIRTPRGQLARFLADLDETVADTNAAAGEDRPTANQRPHCPGIGWVAGSDAGSVGVWDLRCAFAVDAGPGSSVGNLADGGGRGVEHAL